MTDRDLRRHPRGLSVLFLTQMWAEFSYFGLLAMLVYYQMQQLGFPQAKASMIFGAYAATAFFSPFLGGIVADRWLGNKKAVIIGGILMMLGHFTLAAESLLFPGLALVAVGNGLFVAPLSVQVARLYAPDDPRQQQGFTVYYMGTNAGALLAPLICGTLGELFGWHWGFAAAGLGMLLALVIYHLGAKHLPPEAPPTSRVSQTRIQLRSQDWFAIRLLLMIGAIIVLFRLSYEQNGNIIALWVQQNTDRSFAIFGLSGVVPATWFQSINPLLIIAMTPLIIRLDQRSMAIGKAPNPYRRMAVGCIFVCSSMLLMALAAWFDASNAQRMSMGWIIGYFVLLTIGEIMIIPVGLSLFGTRSPREIAGMVMGGWYLAKFVGSLMAGWMGTLWEVIPHYEFFLLAAGPTMLAAFLLIVPARFDGQWQQRATLSSAKVPKT